MTGFAAAVLVGLILSVNAVAGLLIAAYIVSTDAFDAWRTEFRRKWLGKK